MSVRIQFELELSQADLQLLGHITGDEIFVGNGIDEKLSSIAMASVREYLELFVGRRVFRRGSDFNEYRLLLLIQTVFGNRIPSEELVSRIFQTSSTSSKTLIRSTLSKYQYDLRTSIDNSLIEILTDVRVQSPEEVATVIYSDNLKDELNRILSAQRQADLKQIIKESGTVASYRIPVDSYIFLCTHFDIDPIELETNE